jgi:hypothetical protein
MNLKSWMIHDIHNNKMKYFQAVMSRWNGIPTLLELIVSPLSDMDLISDGSKIFKIYYPLTWLT